MTDTHTAATSPEPEPASGGKGSRSRAPGEDSFWLSERAFPLFVAALAAGIFAGTHLYYVYRTGVFNDVAVTALLKGGMEGGVTEPPPPSARASSSPASSRGRWSASSTSAAPPDRRRHRHPGHAARGRDQRPAGALLAGGAHRRPPRALIGVMILAIRRATVNSTAGTSTFGADVMMGAGNSAGRYLGPLVIISAGSASLPVGLGSTIGAALFYWWKKPLAGERSSARCSSACSSPSRASSPASLPFIPRFLPSACRGPYGGVRVPTHAPKGTMSTTYRALGLAPAINASGKMTALGGTRLDEGVIAAMGEAARGHVVMDDLMIAAGRDIARHTGTEDACPTTGAASGVAIAVAALVAGTDPVRVERLPDAGDAPNEVILQKGHAVHFGAPVRQMVALGGGRPIEVGAVNKARPNTSRARSPRTAALLYVQSHHTVHKGQVPLETVVAIGREHGVPVIVDAAAEENLRRWPATGADLVVYSGGKAIGGPTSGIICGPARLIAACRAQYGASAVP
ncbi:DUF4310 family protein [Streptomyces sp. M19]